MKKVVLTFDDGPSDKFRERVDFLVENKLKGVFFCCGKNLEKSEYKNDLVYAIKRGMVIANHTYSHIFLAFTSFSKVKKEILRTEELIENLYKSAKVERKLKLIRFPYFSSGGFNFFRIENFLRHEGFQNPYTKKRYFCPARSLEKTWHFFHSIVRNRYEVYCDIDTRDWKLDTKWSSLKKLLDSVKDEDVICLHDKDYNFDVDKKIIEYLKKKRIGSIV